MRRILLTELRRGSAVMVALGVAAVTLAVLFNETEEWAGRWLDLASWLRISLIVVVPVCVTVGAWQGGRERRRRITEVATATPRSPWQPVVARVGATVLGAWVGFAIAWLVAAMLVARVASYTGAAWVWQWMATFVAVGAAVMIGYVLGMIVPWLVAAPVLGILAYVAVGIVSYSDQAAASLSPVADAPGPGRYITFESAAVQSLWLVALAAALICLVVARRWWIASIPTAVAVMAAAWLIVDDGLESGTDHAALESSCFGSDPEVCLARQHAFLAAAIDAEVREITGTWSGLDDIPGRLIDSATVPGHRSPTDPDVLTVQVTHYVRWNGTWAGTGEWGGRFANDLAHHVASIDHSRCTDSRMHGEVTVSEAADAAFTWAGGIRDAEWIGSASTEPVSADRYSPTTQTLLDLPRAEQVTWMNRWRVAAAECDVDAMTMLGKELGS